MWFQEQSLTQVLFWFKRVAFIKLNQEKGGRRDWFVSSEDGLVTHDKKKANKRMKIKYRHTELSRVEQASFESPLIATSKMNYTLSSTLLSLLV